ncbi:NUDIX hydrolase [Mariniplasma anaerobium]|uniref:NUDIX hydrolase n=1 Tax=Mariniplasma anaerobium TaxID=2735436 RepID=A0A7U9XW96_9MOLU|nr:NUDIX hydrolase [Mariniplasma anaerobium]BCR36254.1 NUDIX hydrolase [Mariniplasma anaerobium]
MTYIDLIEKYEPYNEQEVRDKKAILDFISQNDNHLVRTNLVAHLTSSAIVLNKDYTKVLFAFHNIYQSWSWLGGHLDGDKDLLKVAIKETKEETGIKHVKAFSSDIFMIDVIYVSNHIKHKKYVGDHLHLNVTFLLVGDESDTLVVKKDENQDVRWFDLDDVFNHISEERMVPVFKKAIQKIKQIIV